MRKFGLNIDASFDLTEAEATDIGEQLAGFARYLLSDLEQTKAGTSVRIELVAVKEEN